MPTLCPRATARSASPGSTFADRSARGSRVGSAVADETGACDEARLRPSQPSDKRRDVSRLTEALDGHITALRVGVLAVGRIHVGVCGTGMNDIDSDATRAEIARQPFGQTDQRGLAP